MNRMLILATALWKRRATLVLSLIAFPALVLMYGLNKPPVYEAVQTLSLTPEKAQSNLLQDISNSEYQKILERQLKNETLLKAALRDVGTLLSGADQMDEQKQVADLRRSLDLEAAGPNVIEVTLTHEDRSSILRLLEAVVINFIDDIMAPERFAKEELANSLGNQIRELSAQRTETDAKVDGLKGDLRRAKAGEQEAIERRIAALEFQSQTLEMQIRLAKNEYEKALTATQQTMFHPIIKAEGSPVLVTPAPRLSQQLYFLLVGLILAIVFTAVMIILDILFDSSLRQDDEIRKELGLRILGRMPNLGDVHFDEGRISTMPKLNI